MSKDRFTKISHNYAELFTEVFAEQGLDYIKFQRSAIEAVSKHYPLFKTASILDIGTGDGETIAPFVKAGCTNLTGIDLNPDMIKSSKERFGSRIKLLQADARNLEMFKTKQFDIIITGICIHNIPRNERKLFWKELLRLDPKIFVAAEKIADPDPVKHKKYYDSETNAVIEVYKNRHKLDEAAQEWIDHYKYDEREKLTIEEIELALSSRYHVKLVFEMGMNKTIIAIRNNQ